MKHDIEWTDADTMYANDLAELIATAKRGSLSLLSVVGLGQSHVIWREVISPNDTEDRWARVNKLFISQGYSFRVIMVGLPDVNSRYPQEVGRTQKTYEIVMW